MRNQSLENLKLRYLRYGFSTNAQKSKDYVFKSSVNFLNFVVENHGAEMNICTYISATIRTISNVNHKR